MGKRPRYSRWRRLPGLYRFGDQKPPDPDQDLQRLTLYVPWSALDDANAQAVRLGFASGQDYCAELLLKALEAEAVRAQMEDVEARRGPLAGFHEVASDPAFLAEVSGATGAGLAVTGPEGPARPPGADDPVNGLGADRPAPVPRGEAEEARPWVDPANEAKGPERPAPSVALSHAPLGPAAWVVLRHAAHSEMHPHGFLACLRRGEPVPEVEVAELAQALQDLEAQFREAPVIDRRLGFALHRLAFESQVLVTDAWPGAFDAWTIDMLRAVQESVERILSGRDIRYHDPGGGREGTDDRLFPNLEAPP